MQQPTVTTDTFVRKAEEDLRGRCLEQRVDFRMFRLVFLTPLLDFKEDWLEELGCRIVVAPRDTFTDDMEVVMRQRCAEHGVDFFYFCLVLCNHLIDELRGWGDPKVEDRERALLDKAYACEMRKDPDGYRAACLEWLHVVHGLQIGDFARLGREDWFPRTVLLEDFQLGIDEHDLRKSGLLFLGPRVDFVGPHSPADEHCLSLTESIRKLSKEEALS